MSANHREIWLDDTHCVDCPLAYAHTAIQATVARTNHWIALLPKDVHIRLRSQELGEAILTNRRPVYNTAMSPVSRRGLLTSFRQAGQKAAAPDEMIEMVRSGRTVPVSERLPQTLPRQHTKIMSLLAQRVAAESRVPTPSGFDLHIDEARCTACTLCAKFCPTGALEFTDDGQSFCLTIQPSRCLGGDCSICVLACPEEAVSIPSPNEPHDLFPRSSLLDGRLSACRQCRQPIRQGSDLPDTCFACRSKQNLSDQDFAEMGLSWD
jgi:NAD-dependent dihydropyrimidine dehydrogenase PreA subunit